MEFGSRGGVGAARGERRRACHRCLAPCPRAIDAGEDLGLDLLPDAAANFLGQAPDLGAVESDEAATRTLGWQLSVGRQGPSVHPSSRSPRVASSFVSRTDRCEVLAVAEIMWPAITLLLGVVAVELPDQLSSASAPTTSAARAAVNLAHRSNPPLARRLGPYVETLSFDRHWTDTDATTPRRSMLQQGLASSYCNWLRLVERGAGRAITERDQVTLRFRGVAVRAGGEEALAQIGSWQLLTLSLPQAGEGLRRALVGVEPGSLLHLLARSETTQPLSRSFETSRDDVQLYVEIVVLSAGPGDGATDLSR